MKKYLAWVFFVLGVVNTTNISYKYAVGNKLPPIFSIAVADPSLSNILGAIWSFSLIWVYGAFFYLWWKLK